MYRRPLLVPLIIALNVGVFLAWHWPLPALQEILEKYFLVSFAALRDGRYVTLLGSVFSHQGLFHLFVNMFVLHGFGGVLERVLGRRSFLSFYLVAGTIASLSHSLVSLYLLDAPGLPALGASGAIAGLVVVFSLLFPKEKLLIFGIIPVPALAGAFLVVGLDLWGLWAQTRGGGLPIGYGSHLGGAAVGFLYYFGFLRGRFTRRE